jgi:hypothetical protein
MDFQHVQKYTVRFAHDIFGRVAFSAYLPIMPTRFEEIHTCGEPWSRGVCFYRGNRQYAEDVDWSATLNLIASSSMVAMDAGGWLLGLLASFAIERDEEKFSEAVLVDEYGF